MGKKIIYLVMLIILANISLAATISGTVYDFDLEQKDNVVITVDTDPVQTLVAKDGTYSFEADIGEYTIDARYSENGTIKESTTEYIKVEKDGRFILDLILFPYLDQEEDLLNETQEPLVEDIFESNNLSLTLIVAGVAIIGLGFFAYLFLKFKAQLIEVTEEVEKTKVSDDLEKQVLDFIKEQKGRTTQKEIRKNFPSSEAKISLVITELEKKGILEKIKKGRGNIIKLK